MYRERPWHRRSGGAFTRPARNRRIAHEVKLRQEKDQDMSRQGPAILRDGLGDQCGRSDWKAVPKVINAHLLRYVRNAIRGFDALKNS